MAAEEKNITYKRTGYDGRAKKYIVKSFRNDVPLYEYRCKINGNRATLYPYRRILATEVEMRSREISVFDLKR